MVDEDLLFAVSVKDTLNIGETTNIVITIQDENGNPIVAGSTLELSTSNGGELSWTTLDETGDPGITKYYAPITNDKNPLDTPGFTVITVELESPNGNWTFYSNPIYLSVMSP